MSDNHAKQPPFEDGDLAALIGLAGTRQPVSPERAARVRQAVAAEWHEAVRERRSVVRMWLPIAATVTLIAIALLLVSRPEPTQRMPVGSVELVSGSLTLDDGTRITPGSRLESQTGIATDGVSRAAIRLASGASLRLDHETHVVFETDTRLRLTNGAVYVDAPQKSESDGVEILAGDTLVREIGTQFETRHTGKTVSVRVREGRVVVAGPGGTLEADRGTRVDVDSSGSMTLLPSDTWGGDWAWIFETAPPFPIEGRTVGEFLRWAARETGLELDTTGVGSTDLDSIRIHGSVEGMTPTDAIEAVLPTAGLEATVTPGVLVIRRLNDR